MHKFTVLERQVRLTHNTIDKTFTTAFTKLVEATNSYCRLRGREVPNTRLIFSQLKQTGLISLQQI